MIFLVVLFYLAPATLTSTTPPHSGPPLSLTLRSNVSMTELMCTCPSQQRSTWDIIWTCLAVIFACSWTSVYPNIPAPEENWRQNFLHRLEYMLWTIFTPELVIWWAFSQWIGARRIQREQKDRRWTVTHGHFMQMGGFMLFEGKERRETLLYDRFCALLNQGRITFPDITQQEIEDKSKSNALSKTLVVGQTGWFIMQCITRGFQGLPITGLELSTLGFAALNGIMCFFWWNKPFDVQCPFPVFLIPPERIPVKAVRVSILKPTSNDEAMDPEDRMSELRSPEAVFKPTGTSDYKAIEDRIFEYTSDNEAVFKPTSDYKAMDPEYMMFESSSNNAVDTAEISIPESTLNDGIVLSSRAKLRQYLFGGINESLTDLLGSFYDLLRKQVSWSSWNKELTEPLDFFDYSGWRRFINWPLTIIYLMMSRTLSIVVTLIMLTSLFVICFIIIFPLLMTAYMVFRLREMSVDQKENYALLVDNDDNTKYNDTPGPMHMPPFYSESLQAQGSALHRYTILLTPLAGSLYGAMHCAAWASQFPTVAELWLWRISSIIIAVGPVVLVLFLIGFGFSTFLENETVLAVGAFIVSLQILVYVLARVVIMALTILTLRNLPPGAFDVVRWTNFLPHI